MNYNKEERKSKAGNKTRIEGGKRFKVVDSNLPHDDAVDKAAELRESTGKRHVVRSGAGGTHVLQGPKPKSRKGKSIKTTTKPKTEPKSKQKTTTKKPKKGKLNKGLMVHNALRSAEKAYCEGEVNRGDIEDVIEDYIDYQVDEKKMTKKAATEKAKTFRKCKANKKK